MENLAAARNTRTNEVKIPAQRDVSREAPRIGVFVCNCGINIGGIVRVPEVAETARTLPGVVYVEENLFTCSQDTQDKMTEVIREKGLNRVVVAACTPRTHEALFQETLIKVVKKALGPLTTSFLKIKGEEWNEFCSRVHEWERQKYMEEKFTRYGEFREEGVRVLI